MFNPLPCLISARLHCPLSLSALLIWAVGFHSHLGLCGHGVMPRIGGFSIASLFPVVVLECDSDSFVSVLFLMTCFIL